jgi:FKBP-type peptidyl-prolyl cis-trans isomerase
MVDAGCGLPAATVAVATATASTAAAAAAESSAAATATAVTATAASAAVATSATALFTRAGFVHFQGTTGEVRFVHPINRSLAFLVVFHGHERETPGAPGVAVHDEGNVIDGTECFECFPDLVF